MMLIHILGVDQTTEMLLGFTMTNAGISAGGETSGWKHVCPDLFYYLILYTSNDLLC